MDAFLENLEQLAQSVNEQLWGPPMMIILMGFGIYSTIYLGLPQFRQFKVGWNESFGQIFKKTKAKEGSMSSFQSLSTAVAAQVGTGNIGGVATAIMAGGPGAVFWMWMTALVGMSTIFVEAVLAQKYRVIRRGELVSGPAFYISQGLKNRRLFGKHLGIFGKVLASIFSVLIILALGFIGNMVQSNSIATVMTEAFAIDSIYVGIGLAVFSTLIFIGGMERIAKFTEMIVPFMAFIYIIGAIAILIMFHQQVIPVVSSIFAAAFSKQAAIGGAIGYTVKQAIRYGVARGLFSNEAGMGSTPNSHGIADVSHPVIQGSVALIGTFIDTIIICTATALIILVSDAQNLPGLEGPQVTMEAFRLGFGDIGAKFLAISLLFFAFTTVIGWYYFGEANVKFLYKSKTVIRIYQVMVVGFILCGTLLDVSIVWELADMFNGLMVIPNVIGLFILVNEANKLLKDYRKQLKTGGILDLHYNYPYEDS